MPTGPLEVLPEAAWGMNMVAGAWQHAEPDLDDSLHFNKQLLDRQPGLCL